MLEKVWQEFYYCADVCYVIRDSHIECLERANTNFESFLNKLLYQLIIII